MIVNPQTTQMISSTSFPIYQTTKSNKLKDYEFCKNDSNDAE